MRRCLFAILAALSVPASAWARSPAEVVDPFMGTAGDRGQLSPAAAAPFGMIQLAPDTDPANHIGYERGAGALKGFSQTRAQGVGCGGGGGDLLTSVTYQGEGGGAPIDRSSERAGAGWYHVRYGRTPIVADLAAGQSVSISRFTASRAGIVAVALDPTHSYAGHIGHEWRSRDAGDLRLMLANATVCGKGVYHLSVAARLLVGGRPVSSPGVLAADGVLRFAVPVRAGDRVELRLALSTVDPESAAATLRRELGTRNLTQLIGQTRRDWNRLLARIDFDAAPDRRGLFYTALFRVLQMPSRVDDSTGRFRGADGQVRQAPAGHHRYSGWSLWDNYRTQVPLVALVAPDVAADIADSLVGLFGAGKAQWASATEPFLSVRTEHAGVALLDLYRKGLGTIDPALGLAAMAEETDHLPHATPDERLEQAYDQWAVAELAADRGRTDLARDFRARALRYRPMWLEVFRDLGADADVVKARGLYQGTLWQYRWAPVFDLPWLRQQALGPARFDAELSAFFERGLFNMTNEPDIHAPFLFARTDHPGRADALVARLRDQPIDHWYENQRKYPTPIHQPSFSPQGFAEGMDDDGGAMSAWYVWASIGFYPLVPGQPDYVLTRPASPRVVLHLASGRRLTIAARGTASDGCTFTHNGRPVAARTVRHRDLLDGGVLTYGAPCRGVD
jgi:putative alpha-1,2-mannosidase